MERVFHTAGLRGGPRGSAKCSEVKKLRNGNVEALKDLCT
jgi:hypothetical protein